MWIKISANQWQQGEYYITRRKRSGLGGVYYLLERYWEHAREQIGVFSLLVNAKRYADIKAQR